jgi:hypothetical protein
MDLRASLDAMQKRKISCPCQQTKPDSSLAIRSPVTRTSATELSRFSRHSYEQFYITKNRFKETEFNLNFEKLELYWAARQILLLI